MKKDFEDKKLSALTATEPEVKIEAEPEVKEIKKDDKIIRGSRVKFVGNKSYSGLDISQYKNQEYKVKELSDDRAVLAKGVQVVAAVNIKDCVKL